MSTLCLAAEELGHYLDIPTGGPLAAELLVMRLGATWQGHLDVLRVRQEALLKVWQQPGKASPALLGFGVAAPSCSPVPREMSPPSFVKVELVTLILKMNFRADWSHLHS